MKKKVREPFPPWGIGHRRGISRGVKHQVVGLARRIFSGGKTLHEGAIRNNLFERSTARQQIQHVGNTETKTPNAGAASALSFFHRYSFQPFDAHKLEVYDGLGQRARKCQPSGAKNRRPRQAKVCYVRLKAHIPQCWDDLLFAPASQGCAASSVRMGCHFSFSF